MKKFYSSVVAFLLFFSFAYGQGYYDTFDTYTVGGMLACQNPTHWNTWSMVPCNAEDALISNAHSHSPSNSVVFTFNKDNVKIFDPLVTSGTWHISFMLYIPNGKAGYFNTLAQFAGTSSNWGMQVFLDVGGTGRVDAAGQNAAQFTYPYDTWFFVTVIVNLTADAAQLWIDGIQVHQWPWSAGTFGTGSPPQIHATNFYGATTNDEMYVDDYWCNFFPLPVELTSFTASAITGGVQLNWETATELNNHGFEVQRRIISGDDQGQWAAIGFVNGHGTTTQSQQYSYIDRFNSIDATSIAYRLKQMDFGGAFEYSDEVLVENFIPQNYALLQNFPNPFNPSTTINYQLPEDDFVSLRVYNSLGQEVAELVNGVVSAGTHSVDFDASSLSSGIYYYTLRVGDNKFVKVNKMTLMK